LFVSHQGISFEEKNMMKIEKLNWAGIKLTTASKTILIDAVEDFSYYKPILGDAMKKTLVFTDTTAADYILFTHLHLDHFDVKSIRKCLKTKGKIIVYAPLFETIQQYFGDTEMIVLNADEIFTDDGIHFKPVFAMDGIGDIQCSWIIEGEGIKIFHGGDTIWHNQFWRLGKENERIDYAFLPANGVVVNFPMIGLAYSPIPASLTLEQAFVASHLLHAKTFIPIHYGLFEHDQYYLPQKFTTDDIQRLSIKIQQAYLVLNDGDSLS
jgi:L-ascorbate metabolism protein UlaG (beta-lactamase superfamily)